MLPPFSPICFSLTPLLIRRYGAADYLMPASATPPPLLPLCFHAMPPRRH